jgi:methionyl-tRNA formyltransferase
VAGAESHRMRFAFAGIDFLGDVFLTLLERGWTPVKLFTRPCDKVYDFNETVVGRARSLNIPIQLSRIRAADLASLPSLRCEALIVAGYPWLVTGWEAHLPYALNIHPSPLPVGRGPYPLFQAILSGATEWGITAHKLAPSFDTGAIVAQERFPVAPDETHDSLLAKCQMGGKRLAAALASQLPDLWETAQPQGEGSYWPRVAEGQRTLDWTKTVAEVLRTIRAFGSIEAIAPLDTTRIYVRGATGWTEPHGFKPGTLVHSHRRHLLLAVRDGFVQLTAWSPVPLEQARDFGR